MKLLKKVFHKSLDCIHVYLPHIYIRLTHIIYLKKVGHFNPPTSFKEKLLWLSVNKYWDNETIKKLEDKDRARLYVIEKGYSDNLVEIIGVWDNLEEIDWSNLPNRFVLKLNVGCGSNIICFDKATFDIDWAKKTMKSWLAERKLADWIAANGKNVSKKIICEKYIGQEDGTTPIDYKFYCFNGKPHAILVVLDRFSEKKGIFMDCNWQVLQDMSSQKNTYNELREIPPKPKCLPEMINMAKQLSEPFPFVRVDLYNAWDKPIFGEMTFFPSDCFGVSETDIKGKTMGELLDISMYFDR